MTTIDSHVFDAPATVCGARPTQWAQCLDRFTERNAGRPVVIEADLRDLGACPAEVNAELSGMSYDHRDGAVQIMVGGAAADRPHRTIVVRDVVAVDALVTPAGRDVAIRFAVPSGQILVTFLRPAPAGCTA
jgi:hypothetical protein